MDTYKGTIDHILRADARHFVWGSIALEGEISTGGAIGSKPWTVPFTVPLILVPNAVFQRTDLMYVLIDATGSTIDDFVVLRVGESTVKRMTLGELRRRSSEFLDKLLALVHRPDGRLVYYEWFRVNPFNATGMTYLDEPHNTHAFSDQEIAAHARMIEESLPHAVAEHPDLCPAQPKSGYILYQDIADLEKRREEEEEALKHACPAPADDGVERERLLETKFVGNVPKGADEVATRAEDDALRSRAKDHDFDALVRNWSTEALRQFLHLFKNHVFRGDYRIPRLHTIYMKRTVPGALDAMCCMFEEGEITVWVDPAKLASTRGVIEGMIKARGTKRAELVHAMRVIEHNEQAMKDFVKGTGRPPSPNQWTDAEEKQCIIDQKMAVSTGKESKLDNLRYERERVEEMARTKAASMACKDFASKSIEELDAETERLAQDLLANEDNYRMLVSQIDRAEHSDDFDE